MSLDQCNLNSDNDIATEIFHSAKGWFAGVADEDGTPFLRETGFFSTPEAAAAAGGVPLR